MVMRRARMQKSFVAASDGKCGEMVVCLVLVVCCHGTMMCGEWEVFPGSKKEAVLAYRNKLYQLCNGDSAGAPPAKRKKAA